MAYGNDKHGTLGRLGRVQYITPCIFTPFPPVFCCVYSTDSGYVGDGGNLSEFECSGHETHIAFARHYDILPCMQESYPPDVQQFVKEKLKSGEYGSEDALLTEAVRVLRVVGEHHLQLRADVQAGLQELDEGKGEPWDVGEMKKDLDNRLNKAA